MQLTDWLGNQYGPGALIIYPVMSGRSVTMQQATVLDIWTVYNCPEDYKWKRLKEGAEVPTKEEWEWDHSVNPPVRISMGRTPVETALRVKLQPEGTTSRGWSARTDEVSHWIDPEGNDIEWDALTARIFKEHEYDIYDHRIPVNQRKHPTDFGYSVRREAVTPKPVTLLNYENITLVQSKKSDYKCPDCGSTSPVLHTFHTK